MTTDANAYQFPPSLIAARKCKLTRLKDVRIQLARTYRRLNAGVIDADYAKALVFVLNSIAHVIKETEMERRVDLLEGKLKEKAPKLLRARQEAPQAAPEAPQDPQDEPK